MKLPNLKRWAWAGALCGLMLALVNHAPASWLASAIDSMTDGRILLTDPRGSVWSGSSGVVLSGGAGSAGAVSLPSRVNWHTAAKWTGLDIQIQAPCCTPAKPLQLQASIHNLRSLSLSLVATPFELPAHMLTGLGAPWNTLQLGGTLSLSTSNLVSQWSIKNGLEQLSGQANLDAMAIQTALSTVRPLGSYRMSLVGNTFRLDTLNATSSSEPAALLLSGAGEWSAQDSGPSKATFRGEALAAVGREAALSNLLHIIGQRLPSADGRVRAALSLG